MKNLRIVDSKVTTNTIEVYFNEKVTQNVIATNFLLVSETIGTPDPVITSVEVRVNDPDRSKAVIINVQPLTYHSVYKLTVKSTSDNKFISRDNQYLLLEDSINNVIRISGPPDIDNKVFDYYKSYFKDNIFDINNNDTFINKYLKGSAQEIIKLIQQTNQIKSDRFLFYTTSDEVKVRGLSGFDRLDNEGAYLVTRVGLTPTNTSKSETILIDSFEENVLSLGQTAKTLITSVQDSSFFTTFDKNNLTFNLDRNLIKVSSLKFTFTNNIPNFEYDFSKLGYQLLESKYDDNSFTNLTLTDSQFKLSDNVLLDPAFDLNNIFRVEIEYFINNLGKIINLDSLEIYSIKNSIREEVPPIVNIFDTKFSPITDSNGETILLGGLTILNNIDFTNTHSAFLYEIQFDLANLPSKVGQYSVDYQSGKIYVYGAETNNGTGDVPPTISYFYKNVFTPEIDYVFDDQATNTASLNDLVALPKGNLLNNSAYISYDYENTLVQNVDYKSNLHLESLNERIENRYKYPNVFTTKNMPITGVFRVYNETSGEIYETNRFSGNKIYVNGSSSPNLSLIKNERINFSSINEVLVVSDSISYSSIVFKIFLSHVNIVSKTQNGIAYSANSSVSFSNTTVFQKERFYVDNSTVTSLVEGQYTIDYTNGIVYVAVDSSQNYNIGNIDYQYSYVNTNNKHITNIFNIVRKQNIISNNLKSFNFGEILDNEIELKDLDMQLTSTIGGFILFKIDNKLIADTTTKLFSNHIINGVYNYNDLVNNTYPINFPYVYTDKEIEVASFSFIDDLITQFDGSQYFVDTQILSDFVSTDFTHIISCKQKNSLTEVFSSFDIVNDQYRLYLSTGLVGELISVNFAIEANNLTRFVVDFNDGDLFVDYEYLSDEIIVSYEYGDNVLDFREGSIEPDTTYYVSYKAGALREGLNNFATLLKVPELQSFDTEYDRERFRDAVYGGLSSFLLGSTKEAITNLVNAITHINPEIKETLFEQWILGDSFLFDSNLDITYSSLEKAKYTLAPKFTNIDKIVLPFSSYINLEEGTFSTWIKPSEDLFSNNAELHITVKKNDVLIDNKLIFLGAQEYSPETADFTITKDSIVLGVPQFKKVGYFFYLSKMGSISKWTMVASEGNDVGPGDKLTIQITSSSKIFSVEKDSYSDEKMVTNQKGFVYTYSNGGPDRKIDFIANDEKYIFDSNTGIKNRMSLFFDSFGFLNFKVYDKKGKAAVVSHNCSDWVADDLHHIGAGWKLNTVNNTDELHLFIDGQEVLSQNYWGENYSTIEQNVFRSLHLDRFVGTFDRDIVGSDDLVTNSGSTTVTSSINFGNYNIQPGDIIYINENGLPLGGYSILSVNGQDLILTAPVSLAFTNARFSVNKATLTLGTKDWVYPDLAVLKGETKIFDFGSIVSDGYLISPGNDLSSAEVGDYVFINNQLVKITELYTNYAKIYPIIDVINNVPFYVYSKALIELKGRNATSPDYSTVDNKIIITNNVSANDIIMVGTLGVNTERNLGKYYVWSNNAENIIQTRMPSPIDLDAVKVKKIIKEIAIKDGIDNISAGAGVFHWETDSLEEYFTSPSVYGRSLTVTVSGTSNVNFNDGYVYVSVSGEDADGYSLNEVNSFSEFGSIDLINKFIKVTSIEVDGYITDVAKPWIYLEVSETNSITAPEDNDTLYPVIKYSYVIKDGFDLESDGYTLSDSNVFFSYSDKNNYIYIVDPAMHGGIYKITDVLDNHTITTYPSISGSFSSGKYQILRTTEDRTGFQNGYFTFQQANAEGQPYYLTQGTYKFDYYSRLNLDYLSNDEFIIGNNFDLSSPSKATLDQIKINNILLEDTRIGEVSNNKSITADFNSLKPLKQDSSTLFLLQGITNISDFYDRNKNKELFYTNYRINSNFGDSIHVLKPLMIENNGIFNSKEGTISFWMSPINDTYHDNRDGYYFDFSGIISEEVLSVDRNTLFLSTKASKILKVETLSSTEDFFLNGEITTTIDDALTEIIELTTGQQTLTTTQTIQQIISVKRTNSINNFDYFKGGYIANDRTTVFLGSSPQETENYTVIYKPLGLSNIVSKQMVKLGRLLPSDVMKVKVTYFPENHQGDRMSLYKTKEGNLVYEVTATNKVAKITSPIVWSSGSWHKIKLSYSMKNTTSDTISMWLDGYQQSNTFDYDTTFNHTPYDGYTASSFGNVVNYNNISTTLNFIDQINYLVFGSTTSFTNKMQFLLDDLKVTNKYDDGYYFAGERLDLSFSKNLNAVVQSVSDLYTTYILSGNSEKTISENFSYLRGKDSINNDFYLNIFDSFDIVKSNDRVKLILEKLIKLIKPASSRVYIKYLG